MFTGIVQAVGNVTHLEPLEADMRIRIDAQGLEAARLKPGDSVAVNGVCLTVIETAKKQLVFDVSGETLARTGLGALSAGNAVNLEGALTPATLLGGHLVSGHIDGTGTVTQRRDDGRSVRFWIEVPGDLARYIAVKGSICVDGISLTVNEVKGASFEVNIVPHTLQATTMGEFAPGRTVNIEVDIIARYLERLLHSDTTSSAEDPPARLP